MNGIAEGVRQLRGTSVNQDDDVEHVLVTAGTGVPTSGLILGYVFAASVTGSCLATLVNVFRSPSRAAARRVGHAAAADHHRRLS